MVIPRLNDPVKEEERTLYGVEDKEKYMAESSRSGSHKKESRSRFCMVCPKGKRKEAVFGACEIRAGVSCNCCLEHRKNCILK